MGRFSRIFGLRQISFLAGNPIKIIGLQFFEVAAVGEFGGQGQGGVYMAGGGDVKEEEFHGRGSGAAVVGGGPGIGRG